MKIREIEPRSNLQELALGSLLSRGAGAVKSGVAAAKTALASPAVKNFARGVGNELMSRWTGVDKPGGQDWFKAPPDTPASKRMAQAIAGQWHNTVAQVLANTPTAGTDFTKIDKRQLAEAANLLISQILAKLTDNSVKNISDVADLKSSEAVTKSLDPAEASRAVADIDTRVRTSLNALMIADPSTDAGKTSILDLWETIVNAATQINQVVNSPAASMYGLAGKKIARDAAGNITVDGRVLNRTNPTDAAIINDLASQGLLPP